MDKKLTPYMIAQIKKIFKDATNASQFLMMIRIMCILGIDPYEDKR